MSSLHFVVSVGAEDTLNEKIREVADKINKYGTQSFKALNALKTPAKQVVVGPAFLGVLLEDGRAFRVAFSVIPERLDLSKQDATTKNATGATSNSGGGSTSNSNSKNSPASRQLTRSTRTRIMRTNNTSLRGGTNQSGSGSGSRSTGVIIGSAGSNRSLVTVPATFVPEELITQAQVVLQGKSRNLIIRELQRTNLDVNLAVNNLLSRDDEEGEDTEEGSDNYVPEDLISLLDGGFHTDNSSVIIDADAMFPEDMFGYSNIRNLMLHSRSRERIQNSSTANQNESGAGATANNIRSSGTSANVTAGNVSVSNNTTSNIASGGSSTGERENFGRWRDRQYFGARRWFTTTREEAQWEKEQDSKSKKELSSGFPLWISDDLEFWPERDQSVRFTQIASLYSEMIGISTKGELHQWKWSEPEPYRHPEFSNIHHPKTQALNLMYEKISHISATTIRCSVATENGKIATWMDDLLGYAGNKLEHPATSYPEFTLDKITSLHTCTLYTVARTESGELFWWGVLPFSQRKKLWEKYKAKSKKPARKEKEKDNTINELTVGAQVCMKNSPLYQPGAIGFCISNGVPKVGQLLNAAWDLMSNCRFKILSVGNIPGGPLTSTTQTSSTSSSEIKDTLTKIATTPSPSTSASPASVKVTSGNKENSDRIDMPPPPSPASSTCSDTGSVSNKRQKRVAPKEDPDSKKDEEVWSLKDVVFVEDVRSVPVGKVLKVDGQFAAVRFPSTNTTKEKFDEASVDAWQDCRLMRKDDLQVIKSTATSRVPDCFQKIPRRVVLNIQLNEHSQLLTLTIDTKGIHAIMKTGVKLHYSLFNLNTGRLEKNSVFPTDLNSFMGKCSQNIKLICAGDNTESILILRDGNKTIYPLAKDCTEAIRDPIWIDLPPLSCITAAPLTLSNSNIKSQVSLVVLATEQQVLMPRIMRCDVDGVKYLLNQFEGEMKSQIPTVLQEYTDGNRNIIHACVSMCSPTSNKDSDQDLIAASQNTNNSSGLECINAIANSIISNRSSSFRDIMRRSSSTSALAPSRSELEHGHHLPANSGASDDNSLPLSYWPPEYEAATSGDEDSLSGLHMHKLSHSYSMPQINEVYISDPTERRMNALISLTMLCESQALQPYLRQLLSAKDAQGQTPFMMAVSSRAYQAGIVLFDTILKLSNGDSQVRDSMIFPNGSLPDQSPLHVLCCNDTCSFTWTGADHINQDIFECTTCGLTGSLCCCTECAKVCHKGHDCKLKQTSPTAYCDCWEKCKCKALIAGNQTKRFELLEKLIKDTDLVTRFNSRGESILLFLIQTVGRQTIEQRQYRSTSRVRNSSSSNQQRKTPSLDTESEMPEHDLEPPRFSRKALDRLLGDWNAVKAMILTGAENELDLSNAPNQVFYEDNDNKSLYIHSQSGTIMLDKFTHILFFRCNNEPLEALLSTLGNELNNDGISGRIDEAQKVARRFVRSVARVYVIFSIEKSSNTEKQRNATAQNRLLTSYRRVFTALLKFAVEELVEIADALIAPVRLGVVRPTAPFQLTSNSMDTISNADDLFSIEPLAPPVRPSSLADESSVRLEGDVNAGFLLRMNATLGTDMDENNDADVLGQDDGDTSEQDDINENRSSVLNSQSSTQRQNNNNNNVEDVADDQMVQDGGQEAESDNEFNFHEAETESDSDDNQSTQDAQRSVQTGATAGSDTDEDESGDSSQPEDDAESDEHSQEDFPLGDEHLERRLSSTSHTPRNNLAPQSMQWAIRSRDSTRSTNLHRLTGGSSNLVFIDPNALRRSTTANAAVAAAAQEAPTMATTSSSLARAFGIVLRQISELVGMISYNLSCPSSSTYQNYEFSRVSYQEAVQLQMYIEKRLKPTWDWILTVMDATEAQLRFGASLTDSADPAHPLHPLNVPSTSTSSNDQTQSRNNNRRGSIQVQVTSSNNILINRVRNRNDGADNTSSRRDFLTYCLSLMRSHNSEHRDSLPVLDVTALRHVAYVLDAIIRYMRPSAGTDLERTDTSPWDDENENENDDADDELSNSVAMDTDSNDENDLIRPSLGKRHGFFQRSESTLCLGCQPPDAFNMPITEALPLADQPHLLQPNARREDMFGMPKQAITVPSTNDNTNSSLELPPVRLGLSSHNKNEIIQNANANNNTVVIVTPAPVNETHNIQVSEEIIQQVPKSVVLKETISGTRSSSPKPGTSKCLSSGTHGIYYKKSRHFFIKNNKVYDDDDDDEDDDSAGEEPQDLSQQSLSNTSNKMDIDDTNSSHSTPRVTMNVLKSSNEMVIFDDSDEEVVRSPAHKKNRLNDEDSDSNSKIIHSGLPETTTIVVENSQQVGSQQDSQAEGMLSVQQSESINRPPIIVTRRNVADAIQSVTANVLAKNKKQSLSECATSETPLTFLPNSFTYDVSKQGSEGAYEREQSQSGSPGKSVIVRVGPSTSITTHLEQQTIETMDSQDVSANVTVETTNPVSQQTSATTIQQELPPRGIYFRSNVTSDLLLSRWRLSLILFGRVFLEDVGTEPGSVISELGGFPVKEAKFRRNMEKLRNAQQRDLTLSKIDRARASLLTQTFKELNSQYHNNSKRIQPPLAFNRVKVTFKDEPGEGSGVARSFYTLIAESLLSHENLPNLESAQVGSNKYSVPFTTMIRPRSGNSLGPAALNSYSSSNRGSDFNRRNIQKQPLWKSSRDNKKFLLSYDARPFRPLSDTSNSNDHLSGHQQQLGERVYQKVAQIHPTHAPKITGMLLELPPTQLIMLLASDDSLRQKSNEALDIIRQRMEQENNSASSASGNSGNNNNNSASNISSTPTILTTSSNSALASGGTTTLNIVNIEQQPNSASGTTQSTKKLNPIVVLEDCQLDDNAPLFYQPGKPNFYSPRQGYPSFERINAFRNVGRLIGLCLLQNELLPIFLQRHVLKFILGRPIRFHDLAFFDPVVYESLRQLVKDSQTKNGAQVLQSLELNFVVDLCQEEGGGSVELIQNGREVIVNEQNVYDYVRKYAEYRMIKSQEKALEAIKTGVFDVLPKIALKTLTAEDLRLLLNGVGDINVSVLSNYTSFNDESNESPEKLQRFKRWLWQIVERMTNLERQDLIYFWTGSPALPASEEGFQPMPSVTIRPADDAHLPTANTCISRLYIPLYSSKAVLRHKLLLAIKTKNFGFV